MDLRSTHITIDNAPEFMQHLYSYYLNKYGSDKFKTGGAGKTHTKRRKLSKRLQTKKCRI